MNDDEALTHIDYPSWHSRWQPNHFVPLCGFLRNQQQDLYGVNFYCASFYSDIDARRNVCEACLLLRMEVQASRDPFHAS